MYGRNTKKPPVAFIILGVFASLCLFYAQGAYCGEGDGKANAANGEGDDCGWFERLCERETNLRWDRERTRMPVLHDGVYLISMAEHLAWLANAVHDGLRDAEGELYASRAYRLSGDIDLSACRGWIPIGDFYNRFSGSFDGGGYIISGLTAGPFRVRDWTGLFGRIEGTRERRAVLRNIVLEHAAIDAGEDRMFAGILAGGARYVDITDCSAGGTVSGRKHLGGLVGSFDDGRMEGCVSSVDVKGDDSAGGLTGTVRHSWIVRSQAGGRVTGKGTYVGGLAGWSYDRSVIAFCRASGDVRGRYAVGGLLGDNGDRSLVLECTASGSVRGVPGRPVPADVGRLVGRNFGKVRDSRTEGPYKDTLPTVGLNIAGGEEIVTPVGPSPSYRKSRKTGDREK